MYPSGHNFGNQFVQVKGDKCTVGRIPIHNKLVYWFVTQKVMYGRGGKFLTLLYNTKSITIRIPSTPAYYDFVDRTQSEYNLHISRQNGQTIIFFFINTMRCPGQITHTSTNLTQFREWGQIIILILVVQVILYLGPHCSYFFNLILIPLVNQMTNLEFSSTRNSSSLVNGV